MYKKTMVFLLVLASLVFMSFPALALGQSAESPDKDFSHPVKLYALDLYGNGFGLKEVLGYGEPGWYLTFNAQGTSMDSLRMQAGVIYRIPESFLVWRFYGGGGLEYRHDGQTVAPYVVGGSELLSFLFAEHGFTLTGNGEQFTRGGFRLRF